VAPRFSPQRVRRLLKFGARFQAAGATLLLKEQGLSFGVAAIAGVGVLGLWSLASRLLQVAFVFAGSLARVSFPTMARLIEAGVDPPQFIQRGIRLTATGLGILLVPLVGGAPAFIPSVLGSRWNGVAAVLPPACLGLTIGASASVAIAGYLWAIGDAKTPLRATIIYSLAWVVVGLALLPFLGVVALGIGWLVAGIVDAYVLGRGMATHTDIHVFSALLVPVATGMAAATCGWILASTRGETVTSAVVAGSAAELLFLGTLFIIRRSLLEDLWGLSRQALRATFSTARVGT
jgi:O-antigen/teichoic acid export membrane protein